ncbi:MAG: AAA family ATPase [Leadbetterella sp.]|nr:AAA family ATPase [Leadbetterella sp.]
MYLQNLRLYHFRNYEDRFFTFSAGLNCIVGKNGSGKTNLLDAVYFLALSKSSIHSQDQLSIRFEEDFCVLEGSFRSGRDEVVACHLQRQGKKDLQCRPEGLRKAFRPHREIPGGADRTERHRPHPRRSRNPP